MWPPTLHDGNVREEGEAVMLYQNAQVRKKKEICTYCLVC